MQRAQKVHYVHDAKQVLRRVLYSSMGTDFIICIYMKALRYVCFFSTILHTTIVWTSVQYSESNYHRGVWTTLLERNMVLYVIQYV